MNTGFYFSNTYGFPELFGKVRDLRFNSVVKDLMPSYWQSTETGYKCTCKTLGINASDINISVEDDCIVVCGESEIEGLKYNTRFDLPVANDVLDHLEKVEYKSVNGLTFIYLTIDKPQKKKIEINKL
jgi:HSP20 family molecular chaperone IbpA